MEKEVCNLPPGDPSLIANIVNQLKSQGVFDEFRRDCLADVDTKPAYQNLRHRVENFADDYLKSTQWRPDLNKNQLRDSLRRHIQDSGLLTKGIDFIIDQIVNPKIVQVFLPKVTEIVHKFLGITNTEIQDAGQAGQNSLFEKEITTTTSIATSVASSESSTTPETKSATSLSSIMVKPEPTTTDIDKCIETLIAVQELVSAKVELMNAANQNKPKVTASSAKKPETSKGSNRTETPEKVQRLFERKDSAQVKEESGKINFQISSSDKSKINSNKLPSSSDKKLASSPKLIESSPKSKSRMDSRQDDGAPTKSKKLSESPSSSRERVVHQRKSSSSSAASSPRSKGHIDVKSKPDKQQQQLPKKDSGISAEKYTKIDRSKEEQKSSSSSKSKGERSQQQSLTNRSSDKPTSSKSSSSSSSNKNSSRTPEKPSKSSADNSGSKMSVQGTISERKESNKCGSGSEADKLSNIKSSSLSGNGKFRLDSIKSPKFSNQDDSKSYLRKSGDSETERQQKHKMASISNIRQEMGQASGSFKNRDRNITETHKKSSHTQSGSSKSKIRETEKSYGAADISKPENYKDATSLKRKRSDSFNLTAADEFKSKTLHPPKFGSDDDDTYRKKLKTTSDSAFGTIRSSHLESVDGYSDFTSGSNKSSPIKRRRKRSRERVKAADDDALSDVTVSSVHTSDLSDFDDRITLSSESDNEDDTGKQEFDAETSVSTTEANKKFHGECKHDKRLSEEFSRKRFSENCAEFTKIHYNASDDDHDDKRNVKTKSGRTMNTSKPRKVVSETQEVHEPRREMKRQRKLNPRYASDDFSSIFNSGEMKHHHGFSEDSHLQGGLLNRGPCSSNDEMEGARSPLSSEMSDSMGSSSQRQTLKGQYPSSLASSDGEHSGSRVPTSFSENVEFRPRSSSRASQHSFGSNKESVERSYSSSSPEQQQTARSKSSNSHHIRRERLEDHYHSKVIQKKLRFDNQRYDNADLYKPRPVFSSNRRRITSPSTASPVSSTGSSEDASRNHNYHEKLSGKRGRAQAPSPSAESQSISSAKESNYTSDPSAHRQIKKIIYKG